MNRMIPRLTSSAVGLSLVAFFLCPGAASAQSLDDIEVIVDPVLSEVLLGETIDIEIIVRNHSSEATEPLILHIDITKLSSSGSVDPEDWTSTLSKRVGVIDPGAGKIVRWTIQPISGGQFVLYAVALTPGATDVASSNVLAIDVTERRTLNPEGILPVAIAGPVIVGGLWLFQTRLARRQEAVEG